MWQVYTRRRRIRWFPIGFTIMILVWFFILYKGLSIKYEEESLHSNSSPLKSISSLFYEIDNIDLFLRSTPVKYNYHIFYYPW